jgi:hypoxanthine phosphoribosyltransferase
MTDQLKILINRDDIRQKIFDLADNIKKDYGDTVPLLICVLKGSSVFLADLIRALDIPLEVDFVRASSYGSETESSGKMKMIQGLKTSIKGRHVILVEDIIDTGLTISSLMSYLKRKKPASLKLCALTDKPSRRKVPVTIDYLGFTVPNKFIVGYGIDFNEQYRYLPDICTIE